MTNVLPWWKRTTVYQVYPRSFADGDGDGIGDLPGILGKLDYLQWLGVETIWLSPFCESPQADFGYDISDHFAIAKEYGTLADCRELFRALHARGMKVVVDMVMNHTSAEHPWFLESRMSQESPRRDWYIWRDGRKPGGRVPPNNWRSMLGGSGWHYDEATAQWYFASFLGFQPDLNYRNPDVKAAMLDVVRHWLREGADGLRLDIFNAIFKDASFADNPFSFRAVPSEDNPHGFFQRHHHTIDHPDTIAFARELRAVTDEFTAPERFLVGEVFGAAPMLKQYCGADAEGLHLVFLFKTLKTRFSGRAVRELVQEFEREFPEPFTPTFVFGNHDRPRAIHRVEKDLAKAKLLAALQLTVRGVPFLYYGEEIGMENHEIPLHEGLDPVAARFRYMPEWAVAFMRRHGILLNRDQCRAPMQWTAEPNAGFTPPGVRPWLPVHPGSGVTNVAAQRDDPESLLRCYRALLLLRREEPALQAGPLAWRDASGLPPELVAFDRVPATGERGRQAHVFLNFGKRPIELDLAAYRGGELFSNRRGERRALPDSYSLGGYEAAIVLR